jgi:hypothetical protein
MLSCLRWVVLILAGLIGITILAQSPTGPLFDKYDGRRGEDKEREQRDKVVVQELEKAKNADRDPAKIKWDLLRTPKPPPPPPPIPPPPPPPPLTNELRLTNQPPPPPTNQFRFTNSPPPRGTNFGRLTNAPPPPPVRRDDPSKPTPADQ